MHLVESVEDITEPVGQVITALAELIPITEELSNKRVVNSAFFIFVFCPFLVFQHSKCVSS